MRLVKPEGTLRRERYATIFLDAGQTLLAPFPSVGTHYADIAARYGLHLRAEELERVFYEEYRISAQRSPIRLLTNDTLERTWWRTLVRRMFARWGGVEPFDRFFDELFEVFAHASAWQLYPEVDAVLTECSRRGVALGIVSNWDSRLLSVCREMNLIDRFRCIVYSAQVGVAKPDPGIFLHALKQAGASPETTLHVGDSWEDDVLGARAAGLDVLWLRRGTFPACTEAATAESLTAILELC